MVDYTKNRHSGDEITEVQSTYLQNVYSIVMFNSYELLYKRKIQWSLIIIKCNYQHRLDPIRSPGISVSLVTGYGVKFLAVAEIFFFATMSKSALGAHPASYLMHNKDCFSGSKTARK